MFGYACKVLAHPLSDWRVFLSFLFAEEGHLLYSLGQHLNNNAPWTVGVPVTTSRNSPLGFSTATISGTFICLFHQNNVSSMLIVISMPISIAISKLHGVRKQQRTVRNSANGNFNN